jgi:hypothetical protein
MRNADQLMRDANAEFTKWWNEQAIRNGGCPSVRDAYLAGFAKGGRAAVDMARGEIADFMTQLGKS